MIDEQSARNFEILNIYHNNTISNLMRNVFIENDKVVIVNRYHQGYEIIENEKIIYRNLSRAIEQLLMYYM